MKHVLAALAFAAALWCADAHAQMGQGNVVNLPAAAGGGSAPCNAFGSGAGNCLQGNGGSVGGPLTLGSDQTNNLTISGGASTTTLQFNPPGGSQTATVNVGTITINTGTQSTGGLVVNHMISGQNFVNSGGGVPTQTLSGSTAPAPLLNFQSNLGGTLTGGYHYGRIGGSSDNAATSVESDLLYLQQNYGGTSFNGQRFGLNVQQLLNVASTNATTIQLVGVQSTVISSVNAGGTSQAAASGSLYGSDYWARCQTGSTFLSQCIGSEFDASLQTGASANTFAVVQTVLTSDHAVQGSIVDVMNSFGAQVGASAGVHEILTFGRYDAQWPLDANGYVAQVQSSKNGVATTGAGGFDLAQMNASGSGACGGGFYWRSPGLQLIGSEIQAGYAVLGNNGTNTVLDTPYQLMSASAGAITVGVGGSGFTTGDIVCDAYGDVLKVTASAGAVTGISSVIAAGSQKSPPGNPVTFTSMTPTGGAFGTGLTLNLAWTANTLIALNPSGGTVTAPTPSALDSSTNVATTAFSSNASNLTSGTTPAARLPLPSTFHASYVICQSGAPAAVTGTATETNLAACKIPANTLGANGKLRIDTLWNMTNNADAKTLIVRLGTSSGAIIGTQYQLTSGASSASARLLTELQNANSASSQIGAPSGLGSFGVAGGAVVTSAVNTGADSYVNINGTLGTTTDTITLQAYTVEVLVP